MKSIHRSHDGSENCSCTSCVYKSPSDRPSLKDLVSQGSRIDRLYYGKYIPLREKKLLDRLVRTRAVYDDIRAQLISDSAVDLNAKANLRVRNKLSAKELDSTDKSSAVLKLVNMVDKGKKIGSKNLSECCSCCSCSSRALYKESIKKRRHKRGHPGVHRHDHHVSGTMGDPYTKKKGVRFKAKHIRSDPCTCTFQLSDLLKKHSKNTRKFQTEPSSEGVDIQPVDMEIKQKKRRIVERTSSQNLTRSRGRVTGAMLEGIKKLKESKIQLQENFESHVKQSLEKLIHAKQKLNPKPQAQKNIYEQLSNIDLEALCVCPDLFFRNQRKKGSLSKIKEKINESKSKLIKSLEANAKLSLEKLQKTKYKLKSKQETYNSDIWVPCECPELDSLLLIQKDSVAKLKDDTRKKQVNDQTNESQNIKQTCTPEACFNKFKQKLLLKAQDRDKYELNSKISLEKLQKTKDKLNSKRETYNSDIWVSCEYPELDSLLLIQKDSVAKLRNETRKKQINDRTIQSESIKKTCTPEECFNKLKEKLLKAQERDKYEVNKKISLEKLQKTKDKLKSKHETYNSDIWVPCECPELDSLLLIQKDSVAQLRNDTRNKQVNDRTNQSESMKKTCTPEECFNKLKEKLLKAQERDKYEVNEKISLEKLQKSKDKLKSKHETYNSDIWFPCECPELDSLILIHKDSVAKLKYDTKKKQVTNQTSESETIKNTCIPEECFNKLKRKHLFKAQHREHIKYTCTPKECFNKLKQKLKSQGSNKYENAIVTLEKLQNAKDKLKSKHGTYNSDIWTPCDCPELDLLLLIQKDSIAKYKDDMRKKQMIKDRTCKSECVKDTCIPEQCLNRLKQKLQLKTQDHARKYDRIVRSKIIHQRKITKPLTQFSSKTQLFQKRAALPIVTEKVKPKLRRQPALVTSFSSHGGMRKKKKYEKVKINKPQEKKARKKKHKNLKSRLERTKSNNSRQAVRIGSSFSFNVEFYKDNNKTKEPQNVSKLHLKESYANKKPISLTSYEKSNVRKRINRKHRGSQVILRPKVKDARIDAHALNRCFCTLKLQDRKQKKNLKIVSDETMTTKSSEIGLGKLNEPCTNRTCLSKDVCTLTNCAKMKTNALKNKKRKQKKYNRLHLLPFECEPGVCTPNYCDPHQCFKLIKMRNTKSRSASTNFSQKTKSASTLNSKPSLPPKPTYVQSVVQYTRKPKIERELVRKQQKDIEDNHQSVRIGSTFSFNIEFYKNKVPYSLKPNNIRKNAVKPKQNLVLNQKLITKGNQRNLKDTYRTTPTQIIRRNRHYGIGNSLKRCFCTLKLSEKYAKPEKRQMLNTGTKTEENSYHGTSTFNRSTMIDRKKRRSLEPFECEPFVCMPGQCNPYVCLERIKRRFKDVSVITTQPRSKTGSSTMYSEISGKTTQVDIKPRVKHEKSFVKIKQKNGASTKPYDHSDNYRQAVKLGSSFSFNVEFFKSNAPNYAKPQYLEAKKSKISSKDHTSGKKIKMNTFNVVDIDTQVQKKNKQKSSMVTPLLKRCFCTLNLQKKRNLFNSNDFPPVYTINRAITKEFRYLSCLNLNKACKVSNSYQLYNFKSSCKSILPNNQIALKSIRSDVKNKINPCVGDLIDSLCLYPTEINKWGPIKYKSRTKFDIIKSEHDTKLNKKIFSETKSFMSELSISDYKHNNIMDFDSNIIERLKISSNNLKQTEPSLFKRSNRNSFCAMNLRIERQKLRKSKLLPYECEPGVCIPGECNPYECQKLILARTFKKTSKVGTGYRAQSVSIQSAPKSTKNKNIFYVRESSSPRSYKKPHTNNNNRVVRIGSSFNFDVEFFKKQTTNLRNKEHERYGTKYLSDTNLEQARPLYTFKNVGTKKPYYFQDSPSQSPIAVTTSKASVTLPMIKRCFCTLKLQKRGKLQNKRLLSDPADYQISSKITTTNRTQNTKDFKTLKHKYHLEPYECEPNICDPGNCDPHECLELMKKKRVQEIGVHTGLNNQKSVTSMTTTVNQSIGTQSRGLKQKIHRARSKLTKKSNKSGILKPSRQMVRVGSNFSFSVEFFKDRTGPTTSYYAYKDGIKRSEYNINKHKHNALENKRLVLPHKKSQPQNFSKVQSTMTSSLLKRCFCTAKFYQNKKKNIGFNFQKDASPPFFQRCLCLLKNKKNANANHNRISHLNKKTSTRDNVSFEKHMLDRFECEPGSCIPGECDPYECDTILRNKMKRQSIASSTETRKSRSSYTYNPLHSKQTADTQSMLYDKPVLTKLNDDVESSKKQVARIGSKFSFDIEFYKNNIPIFEKNISKVPQLKYRDKKYTSKDNETLNGKNSAHKLSQVIPNRKKNRAIDKVLKRCFCTLQLYNKPKDKLIRKAVKTKSIMTERNKLTSNALLPYECEPNICIPYQCDPYKCDEIIKSRQHRGSQYKRYDPHVKQNLSLLPYECEPFSCIPGECNPVECLERIKRRRLKNYGTNIKYSHGTESTMTENSFQPKHKRNQSRSSYISNYDPSYVNNTAKDNYHKQAAKIGSKFSFDVEFYKENSKYENMRKATGQKSKIAKLHEHGTYPQHIRFEDATNTSHKKINKPVIASFLKKCFCSLQLNKKDNHQSTQPKNKHIKKDQLQQTALLHRNYIKKPQKLKPFECEPNSCVPGLCDPYECEKRIKRRLFREFSQETEDPVRNSRFIATQNTKTKSVKSQATKLRDGNRQFNKKILEYQDETNLKRQVCRIGSTFSFDITFSKTRYPKEAMLDTRKLPHESFIQTITPKKKLKNSSAGPKKCFCTLKLQKYPADVTSRTTGVKRARMKTRHPQTAAQNYRTSRSTYCDPYECEKQTQIDHHRKRDIQLQADKNCCHKCVGVKAQKLKTRKNQSKRLRTHGSSINQNLLERGPEIVEVPRFSNMFDKQAVKIGSNFSFNIEFYKKTSPSFNNTLYMKDEIYDERKLRRNLHKNRTPLNRASQISAVISKDKALDTENVLKRCFCTLSLHKNMKKLHNPYQQVVEVRRLSIPHKTKKTSQPTHIPVASVSTRINNKYLNYCSNNNNCPEYLNNNFKEMRTILPYRPTKFNKIASKTLLSQQIKRKTFKQKVIKLSKRGKKLTKKKSLRGIHFDKMPTKNNELRKLSATSYINNMFCRCVKFFKSKTKDYSEESPQNTNIPTYNGTKLPKLYSPGILKVSKSDRRASRNIVKSNSEPKKSKSVKLNSKRINAKCSDDCPYSKARYSVYQAGDNFHTSYLKSKDKKHVKANNDVISKDKQIKNILKDPTREEAVYCMCNAPKTQSVKEELIKNQSLCMLCQTKFQDKLNKGSSIPRLKVRFLDPLTFSKTKVIENEDTKQQIKKSKKTASRAISNNSKCCRCRAENIYPEIKEEAGDNFVKKKNVKNYYRPLKDRIKNIRTDRNNTVSNVEHPLFGMEIDADDFDILNKEEVIANVTRLSEHNKINQSINNTHNFTCKSCCKTTAPLLKDDGKKVQGKVADHIARKEIIKNQRKSMSEKKKKNDSKKIKIPAFEMQIDADDYDILNKEEVHHNIARFSGKSQNCMCNVRRRMNPNRKVGPCTCGSIVCAEKSKIMSTEAERLGRLKKLKWKPCECGSPVCDQESEVMKSMSLSPDKVTCICKQERKKEKNKREHQLRSARLKQQHKEDEARRRQRKKEDKLMEKRINKNASDMILLAESVVDIGKLGITACADILRFVARTATDPKQAYISLKAMKDDPRLILRSLKHGVSDSGVGSTMRRVRLRCMSMRGVKNLKSALERHPFTNYLLHIASKDPKRREAKKKARLRERFDFGCSLYMSSLRKRPFLFVYDRLPSFYPHFLALVNVYRQFRDLMLFLLAVVVWSPCILCMEVCRAMMCCLFCTG